LERELGVQIFSRRQRRIELTEAGHAFLAESRRILEQADNAIQVARAVARGDLGRVRLGYSRFTQTDFLPWLLRAVAERHPRIDLVLHTMTMQSILEGLEAGTLDLGFLRLPIPSPLLDHKVILHDPWVAVLPATHLLARQKSIPLSTLRNETFIDVARQAIGRYGNNAIAACRQAGFTPRNKAESDSLLGVLALVAGKRGVTIIPRSLARYAWSDLAVLQLDDTLANADLVVAWRKDQPSTLCRRMVEDILQHHAVPEP
jgi:DNA-binding transcriptional LysR family regulator